MSSWVKNLPFKRNKEQELVDELMKRSIEESVSKMAISMQKSGDIVAAYKVNPVLTIKLNFHNDIINTHGNKPLPEHRMLINLTDKEYQATKKCLEGRGDYFIRWDEKIRWSTYEKDARS